MAERQNLESHKMRIDRVVAHIHANLDTPLNMETLGEIACLSPHHWHRIYRQIMGETASQTISRRRLWRAAHQLLQTTNTITAIAKQAQYGSVAAFSRAFSREYKTSPTRYRQTGQADSLSSRKDTHMASIETKETDPIRLAGLDHKGPHYEIGQTFDRLFAWASVTPGMINAETKGIAIYFDNPAVVPAAEQTSLAAIPLPDGVQLPDTVRLYTIPGGLHAIARHIGPYTELGKTYEQLFQHWLPGSGHTPSGAPGFEINLNDPKTTAPSDLITDIYLPLK